VGLDCGTAAERIARHCVGQEEAVDRRLQIIRGTVAHLRENGRLSKVIRRRGQHRPIGILFWTHAHALSVLNRLETIAMVPETPNRVPANTSDRANRHIQQDVAESVRWHARHPERIDRRLREIDQEWDIERTLEANAAGLALTGILLGLLVDKRFSPYRSS
jgi:hypothetical protein